MSVWFVIPSKRPVAEARPCFEAWSKMGYRIAMARQRADGIVDGDYTHDPLVMEVSGYRGWARSVNLLVGIVMARHPEAEWFVTGGDDYFPDPTKRAEEIAQECSAYFARLHAGPEAAAGVDLSDKRLAAACDGLLRRTFGVMQPTGDRWGERNGIATIDRIAGSPWMGREFCRRMYHGSGPMYNGYYHNFADEELQCVAEKLGVFWQRRDLTQEHRHWARPRGDWRDAPDWAHKINNPQFSDWDKSKALFAARKAAGFPGHEPLEI